MLTNKSRMETYNKYKMFKCFARKFKITEVEPPIDVKEAFARFSDGEPQMSAAQLHRFLVDHQNDTVYTLADAERIFELVLHRRHHLTRHGLSLDDFFQYLFLDDLNGPIETKVHHDMNAPLAHYFIYTGHNSYLTGNQLSSDCSERPIIRALQSGVKVIELDLWPNSAKNDIHVLHGRTLTTPVTLIRCLRSIKEYAFVKSPYPVIVTLEDHLTPNLQAKVAEMLIDIFGDVLYYPEEEYLAEFPSPESLQHKIIISTKPPKEFLETKDKDKGSGSPSGRDSSGDETSARDTSDIASMLEPEDLMSLSGSDPEDEGSLSDCRSAPQGPPQYKRLITIHAGKPKDGVKEALQVVDGKVRRLSLSEQALEKAALGMGTHVVRFTQKNILRVYPKGIRVTSTNYKPYIGWMHGVQMIAFNMQGYGKSLWMMHGFFRANGGCGYVKKPDFLMYKGPNNEVFDPKIPLPVKTTLRVRIYMGDGWRFDFSRTHFDSYSPPDFYAKIYIFGAPADYAKKKTKIIKDDWCPVWNQEFTFPLTVPELALLRVVVREYDMSEKDDFGGQTCLPVSELRPGFRSVPLFNKKGEKFRSVKLLMRFELL